MSKNNLFPSRTARNSIMNAYLMRQDTVNAERCLHEMQESGLIPERGTFHVLLAACAKKRDAIAAQRVFDFMKSLGIEPDGDTMNYLMLAYANIGDTSSLQATRLSMKSAGMPSDVFTIRTTLKAYAQNGDYVRTRNQIDELKASGVHIELSYINVLLSSFIDPTGHVNWTGMLACYDEFFKSGLYVADEHTYNHFLIACKGTFRKDEAERWFDEILIHIPNPSAYSIRVFRQVIGIVPFEAYVHRQSVVNVMKLRKMSTHREAAEVANRRGVNDKTVRKWTSEGGVVTKSQSQSDKNQDRNQS